MYHQIKLDLTSFSRIHYDVEKKIEFIRKETNVFSFIQQNTDCFCISSGTLEHIRCTKSKTSVLIVRESAVTVEQRYV